VQAFYRSCHPAFCRSFQSWRVARQPRIAGVHWLSLAGSRCPFVVNGLFVSTIGYTIVRWSDLGRAAMLAAARSNLGQVSLVMILFGLGAAAPLVIIVALAREALLRWRGRIASAGQAGKIVLGILMLAIGAAILTGGDHSVEAYPVGVTPAWLTDLTTRF
jgi:hypothetical protein